MTRRLIPVFTLLLFTACAHAGWQRVEDGVEYRRITRDTIDVHVTRIDLRAPALRVVATPQSESGLTVTEFAAASGAIAAINADYFDTEMRPIGLAMGGCEIWGEPKDDVRRQPIVAVGDGRAAIYRRDAFPEAREPWMTGAVSGWPLLVESCRPIEALPGSDHFTRAPHPRTAVGLSKDGRKMYLVVADGRREGVPGMTLPELADFMANELDTCIALNLDGGGSTAMWVGDQIVNRPSDPTERAVTNHLGVVRSSAYGSCNRTPAKE
jgi:exopolysaccharide biosynthesis protein